MKNKSQMAQRIIIILLIVIIFPASYTEGRTIDERLHLMPMGDVNKKVAELIKDRFPKDLPVTTVVDIYPQEELPESAYNPSRKQYDAEAILNDISQKVRLDLRDERVLIIVDVDLYSPGTDFVLGFSDASKAVCIISLVRLRNEFYGLKPNNRLFQQRIVKEAVRRVGYAWGIENCSNPRCALYDSDDIKDVDKKRSRFCRSCKKQLLRKHSSPLFKMNLLKL